MNASSVGNGGAPSPHAPRVLIVDDDPNIRLVCSTWLSREGFHVVEAANGQQALDIAFREAVSVVLLDVSMPVLDGFGVAAALRRDHRTREIPFVFLSGERDPSVTKRAYAAGAAGFFGKPFDPAAITTALRHLVDKIPALNGSVSAGAHAL